MFENKMRVCFFYFYFISHILKFQQYDSSPMPLFSLFLFPSYLNSGITGKKKLKCALNFECSFITTIIILCFMFFFFLLFRFSVSNSVIHYAYLLTVIYCQEVSHIYFFIFFRSICRRCQCGEKNYHR